MKYLQIGIGLLILFTCGCTRDTPNDRGASVDVTLVNQRGKPLRMPTDYDDFSKSAHVNADGVLADRAAPSRQSS